MKLSYYGHACFKLECEGGVVVFDTYKPGSVPGLKLPVIDADLALYSHGHGDHYAPGMVNLSGNKPGIGLKQLDCFHDGEGGALRGKNLVSVVSVEGMTVAHMGDLGHELSDEQVKELGEISVMLIPVGGFYTIDAQQAKNIIDAVKPKIVIPMHYKNGSAGLQNVAETSDFEKLWSDGAISKVPESFMEINEDTPAGIYQLAWPKM